MRKLATLIGPALAALLLLASACGGGGTPPATPTPTLTPAPTSMPTPTPPAGAILSGDYVAEISGGGNITFEVDQTARTVSSFIFGVEEECSGTTPIGAVGQAPGPVPIGSNSRAEINVDTGGYNLVFDYERESLFDSQPNFSATIEFTTPGQASGTIRAWTPLLDATTREEMPCDSGERSWTGSLEE